MEVCVTETLLSFFDDRSIDQLAAETSPYGRPARVLGKAYATLVARFGINSRYTVTIMQSPTACLRPSVSVESVLNNFRVTVAREFTPGTYAYNATHEHEL